MYQIRAQRSTGVGDWALFNVNLGVSKGSPRPIIVRPTQWTAAA